MKRLFLLHITIALLSLSLKANTELAAELITKHEGFKSKAYRCSTGALTIGYGTNLSHGISKEEALLLLNFRLSKMNNRLLKFNWFKYLPYSKRNVILDMTYNLGFSGILKFKRMISHLKTKQYYMAAYEMRNSIWYRQVGARGEYLSKIMELNN